MIHPLVPRDIIMIIIIILFYIPSIREVRGERIWGIVFLNPRKIMFSIGRRKRNPSGRERGFQMCYFVKTRAAVVNFWCLALTLNFLSKTLTRCNNCKR